MAITLERGKVYRVKHTSGMISARFISEREIVRRVYPLYDNKTRTLKHFIFQNLKSGRDIEIKSLIKVKGEVHE